MSKVKYNYKDRQISNIDLLDSFLTLNDNWNGNGASKFDSDFINRVKAIVLKLEIDPKIYPTGRGSIQLEYEKKNGDYIEFEIFQNNTIKCFLIKDEIETEERIKANQINEYLLNFYAAT